MTSLERMLEIVVFHYEKVNYENVNIEDAYDMVRERYNVEPQTVKDYKNKLKRFFSIVVDDEFMDNYHDLEINDIKENYRKYRDKHTSNTKIKTECETKMTTDEDFHWKKSFKIMQDSCNHFNVLDKSVDETTIKLPDETAMVVVSGDWHIGSQHVNYDTLRRYMDVLIETPNLKLVVLGDLIDNFRKFGTLEPVMTQIILPDKQVKVLESLVNDLVDSDTLVAGCWGNHDDMRDEKHYGESPTAQFFSDRIPYFRGMGKINFEIGDNKQNYQMVVSHFFKGNSIYNPTHGHIRAMQTKFPNADVLVSAHKHFPAGQWMPYNNKLRHFIQVGTSVQGDLFSKRFFGKGGQGMPLILLDSEKHSVVHFPDVLQFHDMMKKIKIT